MPEHLNTGYTNAPNNTIFLGRNFPTTEPRVPFECSFEFDFATQEISFDKGTLAANDLDRLSILYFDAAGNTPIRVAVNVAAPTNTTTSLATFDPNCAGYYIKVEASKAGKKTTLAEFNFSPKADFNAPLTY
jgi:hypothetical protein